MKKLSLCNSLHTRMIPADYKSTFVIFIIVFFAGVFESAIAQPLTSKWEWLNPRPQGNILFGSFYIDQNTGWACGDGGTIIKTTDGGNNWKVQLPGTRESVRSMYFLSPLTGFACGLYGTALATTDGGGSWKSLDLNATGNLFCVKFLDAETGFITGDTGIVFRTTNAGLSWTRRQTNISRSLTSCAGYGNVVLAAGLNGVLARSTDKGDTWNQIPSGNTNYFFDVVFRDSATAFISGSYGTVLRSTNAGLNWSAIPMGTGRWFYSMSFCDTDNAFVTSDYGYIYRTTNGGSNWTAIQTVTSEFQYSIKTFSPQKVISVGNKGTILMTMDSGDSWTDKSGGFRNFLYSIDFADELNAMACGAQGTVALTTNGGLAWQRVQAAAQNSYLFTIDLTDANIAYAAGYQGVFVKTTNGGMNWLNLSTGYARDINSIYFFDSNTGWACGDSGLLVKTTNGGDTFVELETDSIFHLTDLDFIDQSTGWYSSQSRKIYKTTDSGNNWFVPHAGLFESVIGGIDFINSNTGIAYTYNNRILTTSNGGVDWQISNVPPNTYINSVSCISPEVFLAVGDFGFIYRSTDGGSTWRSDTTNNFSDRIFGIQFSSASSGFICGGNGLIAKFEDKFTNVISSNTILQPSDYVLEQNYPNPFNPSTVIGFQLPFDSRVVIDLYDISGRHIERLANSFYSAGRQSIRFTASGLSSGVYFYTMEAMEFSGKKTFSATRKMLLIK